MGLTRRSVGSRLLSAEEIHATPDRPVIALAGNPNVGKSTVFNGLTGLHQHTGNWPGKTVSNAVGVCRTDGGEHLLVDVPGTYSLLAHSAEEEVARNFICFGEPSTVLIVCDATCLERNLNLVLQTVETGRRVIVCVNLLDEARRKGITVDLPLLQQRLGVPVIGVVARRRQDLRRLRDVLDAPVGNGTPLTVRYPVAIESALAQLEPLVRPHTEGRISERFAALCLLQRNDALLEELTRFLTYDLRQDNAVAAVLSNVELSGEAVQQAVVEALLDTAAALCRGTVHRRDTGKDGIDRRIDRLLTGRALGYPLMIVLLMAVFWLTVTGANLPSTLLANGLFWIQDRLTEWFTAWGAPAWLHGAVVLGAYRVLAWVVSVMLPPMAIFFPLFTLLEDVGYLPRVAYNLDHAFHKCRACGKQALTMSMGFGCNAAGVVGARIIDSPRERLLAVLTNTFVPCNGRFPTLIAILTMFFVGTAGGWRESLLSAALLTAVIVLGILMTFGVTRLLSCTVLKGLPSSFTLEMPPYRKPQIGQVIVRSLLDRTVFVLGRAAAVAAPAGLLIWLFANVTVGNVSLLQHTADLLDPFARLMGLDGMILLAFILGFPANEIVIPLLIMGYMATGTLAEAESLGVMRALFLENGWTWQTAVSMLLFTLFHWPCSTTLMTVRKETGSLRWTWLAFLLPTVIGIGCCILFTWTAT